MRPAFSRARKRSISLSERSWNQRTTGAKHSQVQRNPRVVIEVTLGVIERHVNKELVQIPHGRLRRGKSDVGVAVVNDVDFFG